MTTEENLFLKSIVHPINEDVSDVDLDKVFQMANHQGVLPLCYENLSSAPSFDAAKYRALQNKIFSIVYSQTKRSANFRKIYKILLDNNIKPVVVKGIICRQLYKDLCDHRPSGDEDIFVKKEDFFKLEKILSENGFIIEKKVSPKVLDSIQEITFKNPNGLNIEVHLNIIGTENDLRKAMNDYFKNSFDNAVAVEIDNQMYYTLDYTDHYIYLFYHMFKHFTTSGVGVRQIADMMLFEEAYRDKIDFNKVKNAVRSVHAEKFYNDVVLIANRYMGFCKPCEFEGAYTERLLEDMFSAGTYGNSSFEQVGSKVKVMAALSANGGKSSKLRMLFPKLEMMREHYKVLHNFPYLLPIMWIYRIVRYIFRAKTGKSYDVLKSEAIANKKIMLLKDYGII